MDMLRCLDYLLQSTGVVLQIKLIDNSDQGDAPSPNLPPGDPTFSHAFKMLRTSNRGFSHANNQGLRDFQAGLHDNDTPRPDAVFLLNSDAFVRPDTLALLFEDVSVEPSTAALSGATLLNRDGSIQSRGFRWFLHLGSGKALHDTPQALHKRTRSRLNPQIDYPTGAALMLNLVALEALYWRMDEDYFLYFKELDLLSRLQSNRTLQASPHITVASKATCVHLEGATAQSGHRHHDRSAWSEFHFHRSKRLFYLKNHPQLFPWLAFLHLGVLIKRLLVGDLPRFQAAWKGLYSS
jgi:GT2 family glycosyltransferase